MPLSRLITVVTVGSMLTKGLIRSSKILNLLRGTYKERKHYKPLSKADSYITSFLSWSSSVNNYAIFFPSRIVISISS
jgi:hypothetical protein